MSRERRPRRSDAAAVFEGFSGKLSPQSLLLEGDAAVQAQFKSSGGGTPTSCGIGPELAALLPLLASCHGRRRRQRRFRSPLDPGGAPDERSECCRFSATDLQRHATHR